MRFSSLFVLASVLVLGACGPKEDDGAFQPSSPQPMAPSTPYANGDDFGKTGPTQVAPPAPTSNDVSSTPTTVEVHNDCSESVPIFIGDKPKFGSGTKTALGADTTTSVPRNGDGTVTIWLIDQNENGLASVNVTKRMKKVEIGRSCRTIDAK